MVFHKAIVEGIVLRAAPPVASTPWIYENVTTKWRAFPLMFDTNTQYLVADLFETAKIENSILDFCEGTNNLEKIIKKQALNSTSTSINSQYLCVKEEHNFATTSNHNSCARA